jgi:glycerol-3-phosphate acyltransferase PlsY
MEIVAGLFAVFVAGGYLVGSFSSGYFLVQWLRGKDIRKHGSGGTGFTNVKRVCGLGIAIPVLLLDVGRCITVAFLVKQAFHNEWFTSAAIVGVALGSVFPCFLNFRGGKAVAALTGGLSVIFSPEVFAGFSVLWLTIFVCTKKMSLTNMVLAGVVCLMFWFGYVLGYDYQLALKLLGIFTLAIVVISHRENIIRLYRGGEPNFF